LIGSVSKSCLLTLFYRVGAQNANKIKKSIAAPAICRCPYDFMPADVSGKGRTPFAPAGHLNCNIRVAVVVCRSAEDIALRHCKLRIYRKNP
jgi:hypothetical protein